MPVPFPIARNPSSSAPSRARRPRSSAPRARRGEERSRSPARRPPCDCGTRGIPLLDGERRDGLPAQLAPLHLVPTLIGIFAGCATMLAADAGAKAQGKQGTVVPPNYRQLAASRILTATDRRKVRLAQISRPQDAWVGLMQGGNRTGRLPVIWRETPLFAEGRDCWLVTFQDGKWQRPPIPMPLALAKPSHRSGRCSVENERGAMPRSAGCRSEAHSAPRRGVEACRALQRLTGSATGRATRRRQ